MTAQNLGRGRSLSSSRPGDDGGPDAGGVGIAGPVNLLPILCRMSVRHTRVDSAVDALGPVSGGRVPRGSKS